MMLKQAPAAQKGRSRTACHAVRASPRAPYRSLVLILFCTSFAFALGLRPGLARGGTVPPTLSGPIAAPGSGGSGHTAMARDGDRAELAGMAETVLLDLHPSSTAVSTDQVFAINVRIIAGTQPVDGAEIHLDFDPAYLQVVDGVGDPASVIEGGSSLEVQILNAVDNGAGEIDYAAGTFSPSPPSGTFDLATVRFKALASTGGLPTALSFVSRGGSPTDVVYQTVSVLAGTSGGSVTISGASGTLEEPLPLACGTTETGNTDGYPALISEYGDCGGGFSGPEVVYALQLGQTQSVSITLDTAAPLALIALASADSSDCWYVGGSLPPETLPPATYYFVVDGFDSGDYTLQVDCQVPTQDTPTPSATNTTTRTPSPTPTRTLTPSPTSPGWPGTYENPLPIFCDQTVTGSTSGYEAQFSAYGTCGSGFDMPEVWYRLQVQWEADVYITVDSLLSLYAFLLGSQDPEACLDSGSVVTIADSSPETYYLVVDGTEFGRYNLDIRCEQPATPTPTGTGVPGSYKAFLPIMLRNWTVEQATPTHTISPTLTSEQPWTPTPTGEPGPSPTPTATPTPAGTFQDPIPVACEELRVGNSTGYGATTDDYGVCGSGFTGPEVVYQLQIAHRTERLSVNFGAAVELNLLLLTAPSPHNCIASARPGSYLQLSNPVPGTYFIAVDGRTGGSYAFTAHCETGSAQISGTLSERHAGQKRRYSPGLRSLPRLP